MAEKDSKLGGFGVPVGKEEPTKNVEVKDKNKALSKEEFIQKPTGTGDVKVGGEEAGPEDSAALLAKAQEILAKYGNQESNIPLASDYWVLMNRHRSLHKDEQEVAAKKREEERNK